MNHIFPKDWVDVHPYKQSDDVDKYFAKLADKVYVTILQSPLYDISLGDPKDLSIYLTLWFEDIISGTNVWRTVNRECMRRIGAPLPFYDIKNYYEGEPNIEDIRVLLWYYLEMTSMQLLCNTIPWGDIYYQCGMLVLNDKLSKEKLMHILHPDQSFLAPRWEKVAKGDPVLFYRNEKERERIYCQLDLKDNLNVVNQIPKEFSQGAIGYSPDGGLCVIQDVAALRTDKNPFYNQSFAQQHAIEFICSPQTVTYDTACQLLKAGWLADATMNSINGPEYGHAYLQKHAQFFLDYFHEQHR